MLVVRQIRAVLETARSQAPLSECIRTWRGVGSHLCADLEGVEPRQLPVDTSLCSYTGSRTQVLLTDALPNPLV